MFTNSKLAKSVRLAMAVGAASTALIASNAVFAQEAPSAEEEAASFEKISVTGSRIKRIDVESASPVTIIGRADLEITGLTDIGDFLQSIPSMSGSPIGTTTNNGGNGSVQIDLRGLGSARTLTLVNGKRVVDGGDFQAIPAAMIEQVEILKDGAKFFGKPFYPLYQELLSGKLRSEAHGGPLNSTTKAYQCFSEFPKEP